MLAMQLASLALIQRDKKKEAGAGKQIERTLKPYICVSFLDEFRQLETKVDVSEVRSRNLI